MSGAQLTNLQDALGYMFQEPALMEQALTHSSRGPNNYQRLEFLGDRVLNLIVAQMLYETFPEEAEGSLAKRHAALVQGPMLAKIALEMDLGPYLLLSEAERQSGGAANENILSDVMEALLGALYLDGGLEPAKSLIFRLWTPHVATATLVNTDPKTELQEWAQGRALPLPDYTMLEKSGPDHAPVFVMEVKVNGFDAVRGEGPSRAKAEKSAATKLLTSLKEKS